MVNVDWFFLSHRLPIALEAKKNGFDVTIISRDTGKRKIIENLGLKFDNINFERASFNPVKEVFIFLKLRAKYSKEKPDIVHLVTLKPIIYGGLAARKRKNIGVVNAFSGLGLIFSPEGSKVKRILISLILKLAFSGKEKSAYIFQNNNDRSLLENQGFINKNQICLIKGSGVDLSQFKYVPPKANKNIRVFMAARLLYPKGFKEFFEAAEFLILERKVQNVEFIICGNLDPINPAAITKKTIQNWEKFGIIKWIGYTDIMKAELEKSDIIVYPSYYGEGLAKFLIEACAIGRPIITTDHPGCRECVDDGINGILVPIKDSENLAVAIEKLIKNPELRLEMGIKSREKAEKEFDIRAVINQHLDIYKSFVSI